MVVKHLKLVARWIKHFVVYGVDTIFLLTSVFHWQFLITYISSKYVKFGELHQGSVGPVKTNESCCKCAYNFLVLFCCFLSKNLCFYFWFSFFDEASNFGNINQTETGIGDKNLSVELYVIGNIFSLKT